MRQASLAFFVAALLAAAASAAAEDIYKWTDDDGHVHFGSQPPAGAKARKMAPAGSEPPPAATPAPAPNWQQRLGQSNVRQLEKRKKEEQDESNRQQLNQRCAAAQQSLDTLTHGGGVYRVNAQGEREFLSDEQRQAAIAAANQRVAAYCR